MINVPGLQAQSLCSVLGLTIQNSGRLFAETFMDFCKQFLTTFAEIRRLLMSHVGPTLYQKLNQLEIEDTAALVVDWNADANKALERRLDTPVRE